MRLVASSGADDRTRTGDLLITNQLLYQLSYIGISGRHRQNRAGGDYIHALRVVELNFGTTRP